ncbi:MAG: hypothetical protein RR246_00895, partial [Clostridia bacterium]
AGIIGYPMMAYGMYLASSVNNKLKISAALALLLMYDSVLNILAALKIISGSSTAFIIAHSLAYGVKLAMFVFFYLAIKEIYAENNAAKLVASSINRMYFCIIVYSFTIITALFPLLSAGGLGYIIFGCRVIAWLLNFLFIYDCYAKITTPAQLALDKQKLNEIEKKELDQKHKAEETYTQYKKSKGKKK